MTGEPLDPNDASGWTVAGETLSLGDGPLVMGILNVTPDSFSDGGRNADLESAVSHANRLIADGADILDIGGESTRPGGSRVDPETEIGRVVPVIEAVRGISRIPISVDTSKAVVARAAIAAGASIINDVSGFRFDADMVGTAAASKAGLVLMHLAGSFGSMHRVDAEAEIIGEVVTGLRESLNMALQNGIEGDRVCLDVGIGFGKTHEQNLQLLGRLDEVKEAFPGFPMLIGVSRKTFIGRITGQSAPAERMAGTIAANCVAIWRGANILRVHDVKPAVEAIKVINAIRCAL